jgi:uncharacterized membrane protein
VDQGSRRLAPIGALALAGVLEPIWFLGLSVVFGGMRPGYELGHAISELGQQGSAYAVVWNVAGFGGAALLYLLYALALGAALGRGWLFRLTAFQALTMAASGTFGCDPGCPPVMSSWQGWAHTVAGLAVFVVTCIIPLVAWRTFLPRAAWRSLALVSLVVGVVLVGLFIAGPIFFGTTDRVGFWQRLTLVTAGAWQAAVALRVWRLTRDVGDARSRAVPA